MPGQESNPESKLRIRRKTQFLKLTQQHRLFRDLALNPASLALQNFMMAGQTRLSSVNCFVKWKGDFGYGPSLGLHADQGHIPTPWGAVAHTANSTWCLTEYTLEGGALAWVPGSHREGKRAPPPERIKDAIPAEAPKGSVIVQDCENPEVYRVIAGLTDRFPYREEQESRVIPIVKGAPVAAA